MCCCIRKDSSFLNFASQYEVPSLEHSLFLSRESWIETSSDNRAVEGTMRGAPLATELQFIAQWKGFAKINDQASSNNIFDDY